MTAEEEILELLARAARYHDKPHHLYSCIAGMARRRDNDEAAKNMNMAYSDIADIRDLQDTKQAMLSALESQQCRRSEYAGLDWIDVELDVMHHAVNCERSKHGLPDLDRTVIVRASALAAGHSNYASKFALYCAELALGM